MFSCEVTPSLWSPGAVSQGGECGEAQAHHLLRPLPGDGGHEEAISWEYRGSVSSHSRLGDDDPAQSTVMVMMVATAERGGAAGAEEDRSCCQPTTTRHGQQVVAR